MNTNIDASQSCRQCEAYARELEKVKKRLEAADMVIEIWSNLVPNMQKAAIYKEWRESKREATEK